MVFIYVYLIISLLYSTYIYLCTKKSNQYQKMMDLSGFSDGICEIITVIGTLYVGVTFPIDITNRIKNKIKERKGE